MNKNRIFVVGSANTDMVVKSDRIPLPGETILGGQFFMNAGGKGANQAVAASRLGGNVTLVAKLGNDIFGTQTIERLKKDDINTENVFIDETLPSGTALIMVNEEGENCIVVAPGANAGLSPADIDKVKEISLAEIIVMQLETPMETIKAVAKNAKAGLQKIILNPAPAQRLDDELLKGLFLITPNETEAYLLTGIKVEGSSSALQSADLLIKKGVKNVIITLGKNGVFFLNDKIHFHVPAPVVKAVDTTAAGDVFTGAIAVAISEGMRWEQAIKFAINAASISVTRKGAQASIPTREELTQSFITT